MLRGIFLFIFSSMMMLAADAAGKWKFVSEFSDGQKHESVLELREDWGAWNAVLITNDTTITCKSVVVEEDKLSFEVEGGDAVYTVKAVLKGKQLEGTFTATNGAKGTIKGTHE